MFFFHLVRLSSFKSDKMINCKFMLQKISRVFLPIFLISNTNSFAQNVFLPQKEEMKNIARKTSEIRKLEPTSEIAYDILNSEQISNFLNTKIDEIYTEKFFKKQNKVFKKFGLIPEDYDLKNETLKLLSGQVAAFFEPDSNKMFFSKEWAKQKDKTVISHEYVHKLQHDNFNLAKAMSKAQSSNEDEAMAIQALIEGDATLVMLFYQFSTLFGGIEKMPSLSFTQLLPLVEMAMASEFPEVNSAPDYIKFGFLFPYIQGMDFVNFFHGKGGFEEVNKVFKNFPVSTEQILHPEKYPLEKPTEIPSKMKILTQDFELSEVYENTLGEFNIFLLLKNGNSDSKAKTASEGWNGDKYFVLEKVEKVILTWETVWDSEEDAFEFFTAIASNFESRYKEPTTILKVGKVSGFKGKNSFLIKIEKDKVFVIDGFDEDENLELLEILTFEKD